MKELPVIFNTERNQWELIHHVWISPQMIETARKYAYKYFMARQIPANADLERKKIYKERLDLLSKPGSLKLVMNESKGGNDLFKTTQGTGKIISIG
jgi:hypothetical protein